jgi:hypothetical protein
LPYLNAVNLAVDELIRAGLICSLKIPGSFA